MGKSRGATAERRSGNDTTEDWQNVDAPPQNVTQQSNGKAQAQRQNTAVHWQNVVALPLNNAARWQQPGGCGGGVNTTLRCRMQLGGSAAAVAASAAVAAAQQREVGGGGSAPS